MIGLAIHSGSRTTAWLTANGFRKLLGEQGVFCDVNTPIDPAVFERLKTLSGPDKVTALLLSMGKTFADRVVKKFDSQELKVVARSAATLGSVERSVVEQLVQQLVADIEAGSDLVASPSEAEALIAGVVSDEEAVEIMADVKGNSSKTVWPRLSKAPQGNIEQFLAKEHPQVGAFVLSKVPPELAARIISQLQPAVRIDVMKRMLAMKPVTEAAQTLLEETLAANLLSGITVNAGPDIYSRMADILNKLDKPHLDDVLKSLEDYRPKEAAVVRDLLFVFEDIIKLSPEARSRLFDEVPTEVTVLALKGASAPIVEAALSAVSQRARRLIEAEISGGAPALKKDILKAQRDVADLVLDLADRGLIELNPGEE